MTRDGVGAVLGQLLDLALRHADVVQPLHADLFAGALPHGLFHIVARLIGEQAVDPDQAAGPWAGCGTGAGG